MATPTPAEVDAFYREAVHLADQARGWFDGPGMAWRRNLSVDRQALVATASLATTARLMAVIAWALDPAHGRPGTVARFGRADFGPERYGRDWPELADTPGGRIIAATRQLVDRVAAFDAR